LVQINHSASKPNVTPTFTNDLDIKFQRIGLPDTTIRFTISSNSEIFSINNIGTINGTITIDPRNWIINKVGSITGSNITEVDHLENNIENIQLSPNPSNGVFRVENLKNKADVIVRDMNGKIRKTQAITPQDLIDIKNLGKGIYLIEIQLDKSSKLLRLISY
ncbi:MAG: T9SS C-terminal target domain-containing protein, partial [Flavobacteriales bacterium]